MDLGTKSSSYLIRYDELLIMHLKIFLIIFVKIFLLIIIIVGVVNNEGRGDTYKWVWFYISARAGGMQAPLWEGRGNKWVESQEAH